MPVPLSPTPAGSQTGDTYSDALTLGPTTQLETIQFTVGGNTVLAQVWRTNKAGKPIRDDTEIPFAPGQWGLDKICGIRFRSAFAGSPATVNVVGYYGDDAVPFGNASVLPSNAASFFGGTLQGETVDRHVGGMTQQGISSASEAYQIVGLDQEFLQGAQVNGMIFWLNQVPTGAKPTHLKGLLVDELTLTVRALVDLETALLSDSQGYIKVPFTSKYAVPKDGWYYMGFCWTGAYGGTQAAVLGITDLLTGATEVSSGVYPRATALLGIGAGNGNPGVGTVLPAGNPNATRFWIGYY